VSVVGEFRRILGETIAQLRDLEIPAFAEELEAVAEEADSVTSAAAAVLELVGSRDSPGVCANGQPSRAEGPALAAPREAPVAPERLGAATEHLTALCKVILGRS